MEEEIKKIFAAARVNHAITELTDRLEVVCDLGKQNKISPLQANALASIILQMSKLIDDIMEADNGNS